MTLPGDPVATYRDWLRTHRPKARFDVARGDALLVLVREDGGPANKRFVAGPDGEPAKLAAANVSDYRAVQVAVPDHEALVVLLTAVGAAPARSWSSAGMPFRPRSPPLR